uniref:mRNA (guanine-N(7))-methyltransferase n=1 Tax=Aureoumbra lagunensis TaxID=44058 RepID=A0A7S3JZR9_9STRA|mmetsp:Transcript_2483/g.3977  ORF Transcript_2483/g.3977 Transcript_2483/m.3977 type:complete len:675 (-) Transcript_2483:38-2062(-)
MIETSFRLDVDSHAIAELRCAAYVTDGPIPEILGGRLVNVIDYEKDRRIWQALWCRCWLIPPLSDVHKLADFVTYLQKRGKAAILNRGGINNAVTCVIPPREPRKEDGACLCLFAPSQQKEKYIQLSVQSCNLGKIQSSPISAELNVPADGWQNGASAWVKAVDDGEYTLCTSSAPSFHDFAKSLFQSDKAATLVSQGTTHCCGIVTATVSLQQIEIWIPRALLDTENDTETTPGLVHARPLADDTTAANFYNQLDRRWESQANSQIYHLRRFNNWVKAELIKKGTELCRMRSDEPINVLDLACGKGGDLAKWARLGPLSSYAGVDIAESSLEDLRTRLRDSRNTLTQLEETRLVAANLGKRSLRESGDWRVLDMNSGTWSITDGTALNRRYDVASIQFALHYVFQQESKATTFFADVAALLRPNGVLVATTVDARALCELMLTRGKQTQCNGPSPTAHGWWRADIEDELSEIATQGLEPLRHRTFEPRIPLTVWMEQQVIDRLITHDTRKLNSNNNSYFGLRYWFQLRDSAQSEAVDSPEWLAPPELLTKLATDCGLQLESRHNFADFLAQRQNEYPEATAKSLRTYNVPDRQGSLSPADWDILRLYTTLIFRRQLTEIEMVQAFKRARKVLGEVWTRLDKQEQEKAVVACATNRNINIKTDHTTGRHFVLIV